MRRLALVMTMLVLGSCTSSTGSTTRGGEHSDPEGVVVVASEYSFSPVVLSLAVPGLVELRNVGELAHTWTVLATPVEDEMELPGADVLAEARVGVGQSIKTDVSAVSPGTYQVVCVIPGHLSAGMKGELVIGAG